jgi:hypothetical protein
MSWHERDPVRFALEAALLGHHYAGIQLVKQEGLWRIRMAVASPTSTYLLELIYPPRFPLAPVQAFMTSPDIRGAPHVIGDNLLCMYHKEDIGPETTGKVYTDWAVEWIKRYEKWRQTKVWDD